MFQTSKKEKKTKIRFQDIIKLRKKSQRRAVNSIHLKLQEIQISPFFFVIFNFNPILFSLFYFRHSKLYEIVKIKILCEMKN